MKTEEQKKALEEISNRLAEIETLYYECEQIALDADVTFHYDGPAGYGDCGYFDPHGKNEWTDEPQMWLPSSQSGC